jgi:repressor LexA
MKADLTPKQADCLRFIERYQAEHGHSPSFTDIIDAAGLASKSSATRLLAGLEERGFIRRRAGKTRSLEVLHAAPPRADCCPHCHRPWNDDR